MANHEKAHAQHPAVWRVRYCGQWMYFEDKANAEIYAQGDDNTEPLYTATLTPAASEGPFNAEMPSSLNDACRRLDLAQEEISRLKHALIESTERWQRAEAAIDLLERNASVQAKLLADTGRERDQALSQVEEVDAWLAKAADQLNATPFMQAMDLGHHITNWRLARQKHTSTVSPSGVMAAAANAAKVVEGWSDSKKEYADRVVGASNSPHVRTAISPAPGASAPSRQPRE